MASEQEQEIVDAILRHHVYIDRFGSGLANRVLSLFDNDELIALVMSRRKVKKAIERLLESDRKRANKSFITELRQFARLELAFTKQLGLDLKYSGYSKEAIEKIVGDALEKPLIVTNNTAQSLYDTAFEKKQEIAVSLNQMGALGLKEASLMQTELIAALTQFATAMQVSNRTFSHAVANEMREAVFRNSNVVEWVVMSATLDGRTTPYCMNIDGEKFKNGEGPRPPFHPRCRTVGVPIVEGQTDKDIKELLSYRPQLKPGKNYEKGEHKKLRSHKTQIKDGKVSVKTNLTKSKSSSNYADFLSSQINTKQGREFIKDVLGQRKGARFIRLIKQGKNPDKLLNNLLYEMKAKDLDLDGLKKRI